MIWFYTITLQTGLYISDTTVIVLFKINRKFLDRGKEVEWNSITLGRQISSDYYYKSCDFHQLYSQLPFLLRKSNEIINSSIHIHVHVQSVYVYVKIIKMVFKKCNQKRYTKHWDNLLYVPCRYSHTCTYMYVRLYGGG